MRRKIRLWSAIMVCFALMVTVWPVAARINDREKSARQVEGIEKCVASLGEEQLSRYWNLAKWYNHQMEQGNEELRGLYSRILDLGEGRMGILAVPELRLQLPISHGYGGKAGHDPNSPLPIGGRGNHTVLILTEAYDWKTGQMVYIDILGQRLSYRVESVQVMPAGWNPERPGAGGEDMLTLVLDRGNTRTMIRCVRCADLTVRPVESDTYRQAILAAVLPLTALLPAYVWRRRYAKREHTLRICGFCRKNPEKSNLF